MTTKKFDLLVSKNQPHHVFKKDWSFYYPKGFADVFLPKSNLFYDTKISFYDGAEVLTSIRRVEKQHLELSQSNALNIFAFSYPKGVEAEKKKNRIKVSEDEIAAFFEMDQDEKLEVSFKFGRKFKDFLNQHFQKTKRSETVSNLENKTYFTDNQAFKNHFEGTFSQDKMMQFVLDTVQIDKSETFSYDFKTKLEKLLIANNFSRFIYSNIVFASNGFDYKITVYGEIIDSKLHILTSAELANTSNSSGNNSNIGIYERAGSIPFILDPNAIDADKITGLTFLNESNFFLIVKNEYGWELYDRKIDKGFVTPAGKSADELIYGQRFLTNQEYKQIYNEFLDVGFSLNPQINNSNNASRQFQVIANKLQKQLLNPFYAGTKYCINLTQYDEKGQIANQTHLHSDLSPTICEVTLDISLDAQGKVKIKHQLAKNYLQEYVKKWESEAKNRGLDVNIEELRQQVISDFTASETEHSFYERFIQSAKALLSDQLVGYLEGIQATQKVAKNVWTHGTINRSTWHSTGEDAEDHKKWPAYMNFNPLVGGATDGVIDEVVGIPMAIKGIYGIVTDEKQREALAKVFTKEGFMQMLEGMKQEAIEIGNDKERLQHFTAQTIVSVASMLVPGMQITKVGVLGKTLTATTSGLATIVNPKVLKVLDDLRKKHFGNTNKLTRLKAIEDFLKGVNPKILDKIATKPGFEKALGEMAQQWNKHHAGKFIFTHLEKKGDKFIDSIDEFEFKFNKINPNAGEFTADVKLKNNVYLEYKHWYKSSFDKFTRGTMGEGFIKQMKNYIKNNDFEYIISKQKLLSGTKHNKLTEPPDIFVKKHFQQIFIDNADEFYNINSNLFNKIPRLNNPNKNIENLSHFKELIESESFITHDFMNKIVKIE